MDGLEISVFISFYWAIFQTNNYEREGWHAAATMLTPYKKKINVLTTHMKKFLEKHQIKEKESAIKLLLCKCIIYYEKTNRHVPFLTNIASTYILNNAYLIKDWKYMATPRYTYFSMFFLWTLTALEKER
jgi:hypothetical protein